jgi:PAS domain S-box-containing protein
MQSNAALPAALTQGLSMFTKPQDPGGPRPPEAQASTDSLQPLQDARLMSDPGFLQAIIAHTAGGLCVCHEIPEYPFVRFTIWNERMTALTGYSKEEINRLGWYQSLYPEDGQRERARSRMERMRQGDNLRGENWEIIRADGRSRVFQISTSLLETPDGTGHVLALISDVTEEWESQLGLNAERGRLAEEVEHRTQELRLANRALGRAAGALEALIQASPLGIVHLDGQGLVQVWNPAAERMFGWGAEEVLGLPVAIGPPEKAEENQRLIKIVLSGEIIEEVQLRRQRKDGSEIDISVSAAPLRGRSGRVTGLVALVADITERKRTEQALRDSEQRLRTVIDNADAVLWAIDKEGVFTLSEGRGLAALGLRPGEVVGRSVYKLYGDNSEIVEATRRSLAGEPAGGLHEVAGQYFEARYFPSTDPAGAVTGAIGVAVNVTARSLLETELRAARDAAEAANRAKNQFLAKMSHEMRTPLHGMLGMTQLLGRTQLTKQQRAYVRDLEISAESLNRLIDDILDLSRIEAGKLAIRSQPFSLRQVIGEAVAGYRSAVREKSLRIEQVLSEDLPEVILGDPLRVRQVLLNLLGNAIKFTERGGVRLDVRVLEAEGERGTLEFSVTDTGMGIPAGDLERIFAPFEQGDASLTRVTGGSGLGLAICRQLVGLMGGELWAESEVGSGSAFHFTLPYLARTDRVAETEPRPSAVCRTAPGASPLSILVAEDHAVNRQFIKALLGKMGHRVTAAVNGREAVEKWRAGVFDCILMDVQMPELDGESAIQRIREEERRTGTHVPIFALTAHALPGDRERFLASGTDGYLPKPLRVAELEAVLAGLGGPPPVAPGDAVTPGPEDRVVFDRQYQRENFAGDEEALQELLAMFRRDLTAKMEQASASFASGNLEKTRRVVHGVKGIAGTVGASAVWWGARQFLEASGTKQDRELSAAFERLSLAVQQTLSALEVEPTAGDVQGR